MKMRRAWMAWALALALLSALAQPFAAAEGTSFRDVPAGHWAESYIDEAVEAGIFRGETSAYFGTGNPMTRGAFAAALCRTMGWELVTPEKGSFEDNQDKSLFCYGAVETLLAHGAVTGQTRYFRPGDAVTREEMVVMITRALGYTTLAGLDLGLECPFEDVTSNRTYITLACRLGISGGTSATTFSPGRAATREQAAVMLVRTREKLLKTRPERIGIALDEGADVSGYDAAAVASIRLLPTGQVPGLEDAEARRAARDRARAGGAKALVRVTASESAVRAGLEDAGAILAAAAAEYDGILLDAPGLPGPAKRQFTALARQLRAALGDRALYIAAEVPERGGAANGYDCGALSALADRLILKMACYTGTVNGFPTLPQEPLEEIYAALVSLREKVELSKCSLWISGGGAAWKDGKTFSMPAADLRALLAAPETVKYHSARYGAAYCTGVLDDKEAVVWYHEEQDIQQRVRLCAFFGVESVCVDASEGGAVSEE